MFGNLQGWHFIVLIAVVLLLFGAPKLPGLARSIGQSMRIFRSEVRTMKDENGNDIVDDTTGEPEAPESPSTKAAPKSSTKSKP